LWKKTRGGGAVLGSFDQCLSGRTRLLCKADIW
jgi:hypothetical protein